MGSLSGFGFPWEVVVSTFHMYGTYLPYLPPLAPISDRTSSVHHPGHNNIIGRTLIY